MQKILFIMVMLSLKKMYHCATYFQILQGKRILHEGISRPNAANMFFTSVHAEIIAARWLKQYGNMRRIRVLIWRIGNGVPVPAYCCLTCTRYLQKNGIADRFFTVQGCTELPAVIDTPQLSKGTFLKLKTNAYTK